MGRDIEGRDDVGCENAAERRPDSHALGGAHRGQEARNDLARLHDRHRVGIVVVGATQGANGAGWFVHGLPCRSDAYSGDFTLIQPPLAPELNTLRMGIRSPIPETS